MGDESLLKRFARYTILLQLPGHGNAGGKSELQIQKPDRYNRAEYEKHRYHNPDAFD